MPTKRPLKRLKRDDSPPGRAKATKHPRARDKVEVTVEALPDFFDHGDVGGREKWLHDIEILVTEWAFFFPNHLPKTFLTEAKGYSESQAEGILGHFPASQWAAKREAAVDKLTEGLVRRHVDKMAEVQEQHISASKLGLAQALKMLASGGTELLKDQDGKILLDTKGNPRFKQFRSIDLVNCMTAIEKAQQVYRRAMGLPNDEGGLQQILNKVERMQELRHQTNVNFQINNTQINAPGEDGKPTVADLQYEDILLLIEAKRDMKAKALAAPVDERLKIEPKAGVPQGNFTANKQGNPVKAPVAKEKKA
jgi:hypothetical protein